MEDAASDIAVRDRRNGLDSEDDQPKPRGEDKQRAGTVRKSVRPLVGGTSKEIGEHNLSVYSNGHVRREQENVGEQTVGGHKARQR